MERKPCVYILANHKHGTLYVGMTTNLLQRIRQHKEKLLPGFSQKWQLGRLVWYEVHETIEAAAVREKAIKRWRRPWKIRLVEQRNPEWIDLYPQLHTTSG